MAEIAVLTIPRLSGGSAHRVYGVAYYRVNRVNGSSIPDYHPPQAFGTSLGYPVIGLLGFWVIGFVGFSGYSVIGFVGLSGYRFIKLSGKHVACCWIH